MGLRAGDWVEVRSKDEILRTLDAQGARAAMPFMPEMFAYCGQRLRVSAVAHKTCDTVNWSGNRALAEAVHLEGARCNGAAHGGCQAACLLFWNTAWLKPVDETIAAPVEGAGCTEDDVAAAAHRGEKRFRCQATELPRYTRKLRNLDPRQYVADLLSGNVGPVTMARTFIYFAFDFVTRPRRPQARMTRWLYDSWQKLWGGTPYPRRAGTAAAAAVQPVVTLDLRPGDLVRVKSYEAILTTLDSDGRNRGMLFDAELAPYCGGVFRVRNRVDRYVEEQTGKLKTLKTPAVILENVWCRSHFSERRLFCPRAIYSWWREAWLERAPDGAEPSAAGCAGAHAILRSLLIGG